MKEAQQARSLVLGAYLVFLATIPFGNLPVLTAMPWVTPTKLGFLFLVACVVFAFVRGWRPQRLSGMLVVTGLFVIGVTASAARSPQPGESMVHVMRLVALAALGLVTAWVASEPGALSRILATLFSIAGVVAVLGVVQTLTGKTVAGFGEYSYFGRMIMLYDHGDPDGPTIIRAAGTFDHPNLFGAFLLAALPWGLVAMGRTEGRKQGAVIAAVVILVLALVFTFSRSAWLAFGVGTLLLLAGRQVRLRGLLVLVAGGLLAIALCPAGARVILGDRVTTPQPYDVGRLYSYRAAGRMMGDRPLSGVGPGRFHAAYGGYADADEDYHQSPMHHMDAHNSYLGMGAETGLLGLLPFMGVLLIAGRGMARHSGAEAWCLAAALLALVFQSVFQSLQYQEVLWIVMGCCCGRETLTRCSCSSKEGGE